MLKFKVKESNNYKFHYLDGSLAEKEIDLIIEEQESVLEDLEKFFNLKVPFKIQYFLLNNYKQISYYYGEDVEYNGFAMFPDKVYALYNEEVKCIGHHEDAHIVSNLIGRPPSFIEEGIAMYFDKTWWGKENNWWVIKYLQEGSYINITELMYDENKLYLNAKITYPIAGAFTKFLIDQYGKKNYIKLYKNNIINDEVFISIYGKTLVQLEECFLRYIEIGNK